MYYYGYVTNKVTSNITRITPVDSGRRKINSLKSSAKNY